MSIARSSSRFRDPRRSGSAQHRGIVSARRYVEFCRSVAAQLVPRIRRQVSPPCRRTRGDQVRWPGYVSAASDPNGVPASAEVARGRALLFAVARGFALLVEVDIAERLGAKNDETIAFLNAEVFDAERLVGQPRRLAALAGRSQTCMRWSASSRARLRARAAVRQKAERTVGCEKRRGILAVAARQLGPPGRRRPGTLQRSDTYSAPSRSSRWTATATSQAPSGPSWSSPTRASRIISSTSRRMAARTTRRGTSSIVRACPSPR